MKTEIKFCNLFHYIVYKFKDVPGEWTMELYDMLSNKKCKDYLIPAVILKELDRLNIFLHIPEEVFQFAEPLLHLTDAEYEMQMKNLEVLLKLQKQGCEIIL